MGVMQESLVQTDSLLSGTYDGFKRTECVFTISYIRELMLELSMAYSFMAS